MTLAINGGSPLRTEQFHGWPIYGQEEEANLIQVLRKNQWAVGKRTGIINEFETKFAAYHNISSAVGCSNCTHALEVMLSAYGIGHNDEVIVPAYTFMATASAVAKVGATPVFADVDPDTLLLDPQSVEAVCTSQTKAIIAVHFAGHFADMQALKVIADKKGLVIIEDAAQAHGAKWAGIGPGHYAPAGFSFQYSKNMTAGEGGIIISNDSNFIEKCWEQIWHGRKKNGLWYEHFQTTSNYRITEWSAAVLLAQLSRLDEHNKLRMQNANYLTQLLNQDGFVKLYKVDPRVEVHPRHIFLMKLDRTVFGNIPRNKVVEALIAEGLPFASGYQFPLYKNPAFQNGNWGIQKEVKTKNYQDLYLENTEQACKDSMWILHHILLGTRKDMEDLATGIQKVVQHLGDLA